MKAYETAATRQPARWWYTGPTPRHGLSQSADGAEGSNPEARGEGTTRTREEARSQAETAALMLHKLGDAVTLR